MKYIILTCTTLLLVGCNFEVYRYPCQDPNNWTSPECQKPQCEVSRTCPEHIFKSQSGVAKTASLNSRIAEAAQSVNKGGCK